jgi:hypothetical protein
MDDERPGGEEAKAQRLETVMPFVWGILGVVAALAFTLWLVAR